MLTDPRIRDLALATTLATSSVLLAHATTGNAKLRFFYGGAFDDSLVRWWLGAGVLLVALLARRRLPVLAYLLALAMVVLHARADLLPPLPVDYTVLVCLFTAADRKERVLSGALLLVGVAVVLLAIPAPAAIDPFPEWHNTTLASIVLALLAWVAGDSVRTRRAYLGEVQARAREAEHERVLETRLAVAAERERIARELHDVIAHGLSVMIVQAQGARAALADAPDQTGHALQDILETGRRALADMRRLLHVARQHDDSEADLAPPPGVEQLPTLAEQIRRSGVPVRLQILGAAHPLDPTTNLLIFRVIQEALTNVLKHAGPGATTRVTVTFSPEAVDVEVLDSGPQQGGDGRSVNDRPGYGLIGMKERVRLLGGSLNTGHGPEGGFHVHARIPALADPSRRE